MADLLQLFMRANKRILSLPWISTLGLQTPTGLDRPWSNDEAERVKSHRLLEDYRIEAPLEDGRIW